MEGTGTQLQGRKQAKDAARQLGGRQEDMVGRVGPGGESTNSSPVPSGC